MAQEFANTILRMAVTYLKGKVTITPPNLGLAIKKKVDDYLTKLHDVMHPSVFAGDVAESYDNWDNDNTILDGRRENLSNMRVLEDDERSAENIDID